MLPLKEVGKGERTQEAGENPARSRHCDRGANPDITPLPSGDSGKAGGA